MKTARLLTLALVFGIFFLDLSLSLAKVPGPISHPSRLLVCAGWPFLCLLICPSQQMVM